MELRSRNRSLCGGYLTTEQPDSAAWRTGANGQLPRAAAQGRVGGLCQEAVCRATRCTCLPVALHPPRRDLQSPTDFRRRSSRRSSRKLGCHRCYARLVVEIVGCRRSRQANSNPFLAEMPGSAPTYKRECDALLTQACGTRTQSWRFGRGLVLASPQRAIGSTQLLHRSPDLQRFVEYGNHSYIVGSTQHAPRSQR